MILVTVGTSPFDFARLLREVDRLAMAGALSGVIAQTGRTRYAPLAFEARAFIPNAELRRLIAGAEFVISHGGCGTLEECLGLGKKVIVVPRQARFGENVDDNQLEIARHLGALDRAIPVEDVSTLADAVRRIREWRPKFRASDSWMSVRDSVEAFIRARAGHLSR
ncbi:hypothetical protein LLG95_15075 [bacterium]|nr:hypothetical protein [bacterium]